MKVSRESGRKEEQGSQRKPKGAEGSKSMGKWENGEKDGKTDAHGRLSFGGFASEPGLSPLDEWNAKVLDLCAPRDWTNPKPPPGKVYDLVAIGAGAGGLVSSKQSARRGFKSALIEKHIAGGDCLNVGCVPSKALLACARAVKTVKESDRFAVTGVNSDNVGTDFAHVMRRMREARAKIAPADSFIGAQNLGVDVYQGHAEFTGPHSLRVGNQELHFRKAVIATGARAALPEIAGLDTVPFLTNSNLFNLEQLPKHLIILGGGPIASEIGQAFQAFGSKVTCVLRSDCILPQEDQKVSSFIMQELSAQGIHFVHHFSATRVEKTVNGNVRLIGSSPERADPVVLEGDALFIAVGRKPNTEGLNLEAAGVQYSDSAGVQVNDLLQTSNPDIYAVGDICSALKFTHVSGTQAQMVVDNALFHGFRRASKMVIPRVTYTDPEVASVGMTKVRNGEQVDVYEGSLEHNDRGIVSGSNKGLVRILCKKGTDQIIGATICCENAGEMISELTLAIQFGIGLGLEGLGNVIHSYPTMAECIAGCAFQFKMKHWKKFQDGRICQEPYRATSPHSTPSSSSRLAIMFAFGATAGMLVTLFALNKRN